jgi:CubicO group peptidase (beta-lactamase class C family)
VLRATFVFLLASSALAPVSPAAAADAASTGSVEELLGLWKAKRWFGPSGRGPLVIEKTGPSFAADMMGRILPVHSEAGELAFELPGGQGSFRGKLQAGGEIRGHWLPPNSSAEMVGGKYASPVALTATGRERWEGEVIPFEDVFTFYLLARKRPDGSVGVFLRNPDRDFGAQIGAERLARDGNVVRLFGTPRGQKEERELARGTFDAENERLTLNFPNRGGSYDFKRDGDESNFYPRGKNPGRFAYRPPLSRDDAWPVGTLEETDIDRPAIERFIQKILDTPMESVDTPEIHGILVARHGKLVLEEYFHGFSRDQLHETRSAAKSVTAVIVGAAIQAGAPIGLSAPVYQVMNGGAFPADLDSRKRAMELENLLTMSSGYFCDDTNPEAPGNEDTMQDQTEEPDYYRYTLRVPMASEPGEKAVYCSCNANLALGMVGQATGESPLDTFDRLVGIPMKIIRYGWPLDPVGHPYGGGGVQFLPRDFLKFGQLMLNGGTWEGRSILSRGFAARASAPLYHLRNVTYGYLWWSLDFPYKNRTVHAFFAGGAGGQSVVVIPELDLVVATFAGNYSSAGTKHTTHELIPNFILPAVRETGDDKNAPVIERDFVSPYGPSPINGPVER